MFCIFLSEQNGQKASAKKRVVSLITRYLYGDCWKQSVIERLIGLIKKIEGFSSLCKNNQPVVCSTASFCCSRSKQQPSSLLGWEKSSVKLMRVFTLWPGMTSENPLSFDNVGLSASLLLD